MDMRIIGCLAIIGILFSYVPVFSMDGCPVGNHMGNMKMDCGSPFHCPMVVNIVISGNPRLPLNGLLIPIGMLLLPDESPRSIFHPPKYFRTNFDPVGMKKKEQASV
jgi:hypothetical protein